MYGKKQNMSHTVEQKGARGTKLCTSTGLDNSSLATVGKEQLKNSMVKDAGLSRSVKDGNVPSI